MGGQRIGYTRVSTVDQNTKRQLDGLALDRVFEDGVSGKGANRPALKDMLDFACNGDEALVHSMDRLARNLADLRNIVKQLTNNGVKVTFVKESLTFTGEDSPMANLMLNIMGAVAEFERQLMLERQKEGIAKILADSDQRAMKYAGRRPKLSASRIEELKERVQAGGNKSEIAKGLKISRASLYEYIK
ncbi:recombinase family protein [Crenobacter sp. SG2303]|uniref:Recombinase family protein n=1 Tax=Crenobacter oryzisoli TaxID=3056844 RepID=A0ABT7XRJ9_9NEIS|nr:recombinase family protein [Crenobacter sp. SG2303]MDN0076424.1 recombinase family protein [Crenobacter sp. SG2303]